jgi:hypothetical protein
MSQDQIPFMTGRLRERIVLGVLSLPMAVCCAWLAYASYLTVRDIPSGTTIIRTVVFESFRHLSTELFAVAAIFLVLGFVWAVFRPAWIDSALLKYGHRVWRSVCLLLFGLFLLAAGSALVQHVR